MNSRPSAIPPSMLRTMLADALRHHHAGRAAEAERTYRRILAVDPRHADSLHLLGMLEHQAGHPDCAAQMIREAIAIDAKQAHYYSNLGTVLHAQGKADEAAASYGRALELNPDLAEVHVNVGNLLQAQGRLNEAGAQYERALTIRPECAEAFYNLGNARQAQGKLDEAAACQERALALKPDYADAHNNLGVALAALGRIADAIVHYERALELNPKQPNVHNNLGAALTAQNRFAEGIGHHERALELNPCDAIAHCNMGIALMAQGRIAEGMVHYRRALELNPGYANAYSNLGSALASQGRTADAIACYEQALLLNPEHGHAHNNLGVALSDSDKIEEALAHYARALALNPKHAETLNNLGNAYKAQGRFDEALAHYGRAVAIRPAYAEAHFNRAEIKVFHRGDADLGALEELAPGDEISASQAMFVHFALAKALEDAEDYARAFEHLRRGNALKRGQIDYDDAATVAMFRRVATVFDRGLLEQFRGAGDPSQVPIFVLGMPRSGSTLVEQILAGHPRVHGAGERDYIEKAARELAGGEPPLNCPAWNYPECIPAMDRSALRRLGESYLQSLPPVADGTLRIVDKAPGNFLYIGLIRLILPNARIIHTTRDPMDTCASCFSKLFASGMHFTYDLAELGRYYCGYRELMEHWRRALPPGAILDVSYEDVVEDLEGQARRLIDYCGLDWDDRCLSFHSTAQPVKTASAVQVRQPLFRRSLQRWRRYESGLAPLARELEKLPRPQRRVRPTGISVGGISEVSALS
jgi:tetratricopeptide (TPR) repeat protein